MVFPNSGLCHAMVGFRRAEEFRKEERSKRRTPTAERPIPNEEEVEGRTRGGSLELGQKKTLNAQRPTPNPD